jgi:glycerate kinase
VVTTPGTARGHVLVAPDKFKGSLTAAEVAAHVAAGLRRAAPGVVVRELPVADGGEGTLAAALAAGFAEVALVAAGPPRAPRAPPRRRAGGGGRGGSGGGGGGGG